MLSCSKARAVGNDKRAIFSIPMVCSAAIIAAAAVSLPSRVIAAVHAPQSATTIAAVHVPQSATTKATAECTHEVWPYYSANCLRRDDGRLRTVRVIPVDQVAKN